MTTTTYTATVTCPDGTTRTYNRHGDSSRVVVFGRDAKGVRKQEQPYVAQWCANADGAQNVLPEWQRFGGEWSILPVAYDD